MNFSTNFKGRPLVGEKILVTGGAGFIMTNFINEVVNDNKITIFDNFSRDSFSKSKLVNHINIDVIQGDVASIKDLSALQPHTIIVHAAAVAGIHNIAKNPINTMNINFLGSWNLLKVVNEWRGVKRFVNFSTSEIFGQIAYRARETDFSSAGASSEARWTYAVSKLAAEHLAFSYYRQHGLPIVNLRPFNIYGPGQVGEGALIQFIKAALRNEDIVIDGDGAQIRAWCYIDDFISALLASVSVENIEGNSYNIGNPRGTITILGLANMICRVLQSKSRIVHGPRLAEDIDIRVPDSKKATDHLGFLPKIDLEEGIVRTAVWLSEIEKNGAKPIFQ